MTNNDLREHPLFQNRKRILTVVEPAQPIKMSTSTKAVIALNIGLVFAISIALGAQNALAPILTNIGDWWAGLLTGIMGQTNGQALAGKTAWTLARVGGIMAYIFSFFTVVLGLLTRMGIMDRYFRRAKINAFHRSTTVALLIFVTLHGFGLIVDSYSQVHISDILFPFLSGYRTFWTGLGTLAFEMMLAVAITAWQAKRVGFKVWRTIHFASFAIFFSGLAHGFMAGSDSDSAWMRIIYAVTGLTVIGLSAYRFAKTSPRKASPRRKAATA